MTHAALGCPFTAFRIEGDSYHSSIKKHAKAITKDPTLIEKTLASVNRERGKKRT